MATNDAQTLYYFDCLDGSIGDHYWSLEDLAAMLNAAGEMREFTEEDALRFARGLEATLYRCEVSEGVAIDGTCIYDPFACF